MKRVFSVLLGILIFSDLSAREFTSGDGRKINGELLAHSGEQVILKVGAKEFVVPVASFSLDDQQFIKDWITQNPGAVRYKFGFFFDFEEDRSGRNQRKAPGNMIQDKLKTIPYVCEVVVFNKEVAPVENLEIRYEIYIDDFVDIRGNSFTGMAVGAEKRARIETVAGRLEVARIEAGGRIDFTRTFNTEFYIDRDGGKTDEAALDKVRGVRLRVYKGGVVIGEDSTGEAGRNLDGIAWQDTEPTEGTVVKQ